MSDEWDCYEPSEDEWATLDPGAFEVLGNIKAQSAISTKALTEFLRRLKKPAGTMQQSKSKLAASIATALLIHPNWSQVSPATIHVAQVGGDKTDPLEASFAVEFRLDANAPVQRLVFRPVPLDLVPSAQKEAVTQVDMTQSSAAAPTDPMTAVLALLQEQKVAMEASQAEQRTAMNEQKAASE